MQELPQASVDAGIQEATPPDTSLPVVVDSISGEGMSSVILALAETNSKSMGSGVVARLVASHVQQLTHQLSRANHQLQSTRENLDAKTEELGQAKLELALSKQSTSHALGRGTLQLFSNTVGLVLFGVAVDLYKSNYDRGAYIVGTLGVVLVVLGWVLPYLRGSHD